MIRYYLIYNCIIDECETIRDIFIDCKTIKVVIDDLDMENSYEKLYELVSFDVV